LPSIKQLFFDCDNTLVKTEGLAFSVTADVVNGMLAKKGIAKRYDGTQLVMNWIGLTFKEMMPFIAEKHGFKLTEEDVKEFRQAEEDAVIEIIMKDAKACKGVTEVLEKLQKDGEYPMAVVSSSSTRRITAALQKADLLRFFKPEHIYSAMSSLPKPVGKPEPDVYIHAMKELGLKPEECLTVEDSRVGMFAANGAGIPVIGYVGCYNGTWKAEQLESDFEDQDAITTMYSWDEYLGILSEVTA
jgi:HAD superfamily hydrolase (TIGR01509 family)